MNKSITFAQFENVLGELGFHRKTIPEIGIAYEHPTTETLLVVRFHEPNEVVPWHVMTSARHHLDSDGVIKSEDFEALLRQAAA